MKCNLLLLLISMYLLEQSDTDWTLHGEKKSSILEVLPI